MTAEIPADVRALILEHIGSVVQLEAMLLMRRAGDAWTPERLARELRVTCERALRCAAGWRRR